MWKKVKRRELKIRKISASIMERLTTNEIEDEISNLNNTLQIDLSSDEDFYSDGDTDVPEPLNLQLRRGIESSELQAPVSRFAC